MEILVDETFIQVLQSLLFSRDAFPHVNLWKCSTVVLEMTLEFSPFSYWLILSRGGSDEPALIR